MEKKDKQYMRAALELAARGAGRVSPNPLVGCVIVRDGEIIGEGYHQRCGGLHAERNALESCRVPPVGAALYVNLEPCCHHGRTPPCTDAIIAAGIGRVAVGVRDPNPLVAGKGIAILREHGIEVTEGVSEKACRDINEVFFHFIRYRTPYVVIKTAMTLDGKIATVSGESRGITGKEALARVHRDRNRYSAIMVGVGTVIADDPHLGCRLEGGRNPTRIICDTDLRTPVNSRIVRTAAEIPTIIATACTDAKRHKIYTDKDCRIVTVGKADGGIDLNELMAVLGGEGIDGILLEGGSALNSSALRAGIVKRIQAYIAPKIFGGERALTPVGGEGIQAVADAYNLKWGKMQRIGTDYLLEATVL